MISCSQGRNLKCRHIQCSPDAVYNAGLCQTRYGVQRLLLYADYSLESHIELISKDYYAHKINAMENFMQAHGSCAYSVHIAESITSNATAEYVMQ